MLRTLQSAKEDKITEIRALHDAELVTLRKLEEHFALVDRNTQDMLEEARYEELQAEVRWGAMLSGHGGMFLLSSQHSVLLCWCRSVVQRTWCDMATLRASSSGRIRRTSAGSQTLPWQPRAKRARKAGKRARRSESGLA